MDELLTKFFGCFAFHVQNGNQYQNGYLVVIVLTVVPPNCYLCYHKFNIILNN